jgi:IclR family transcriptional regulator, acetate operon repressor
MPNSVRIYEPVGPGEVVGAADPHTTQADGTVTGRLTHGGSRTVDRALALLVLISRAKRPLRFSDVQRQTGIPKGTLHGLVRSLVAGGFLQSTSAGLSVGLTAFEVGTTVPLVRSARSIADPALDALTAATRESSHFGTLLEGDVLYLNRRAASYDLLSISRIGHRKRAYGTALGKAMLARLDDDEITALYPSDLERLTPNTIPTRDQLLADLGACRRRGYASECQESTVGVRCIGMAVNVDERLFGLSLTAPVQRVSAKELDDMQPLLASAVEQVERMMRVSAWLGEMDVEMAPELTSSPLSAGPVTRQFTRRAREVRQIDGEHL